jgi:creatinine amidohydrolase
MLGEPSMSFNLGSNRATVVVADPPFDVIWRREGLPDVEGGHADSFTTSLMLHRRPNDVRREEVPPTPSKQPDRAGSELDFRRYSETGVIGDARHASAEELGERLWSACVDRAADFLREAAHQPIDSSNRKPV